VIVVAGLGNSVAFSIAITLTVFSPRDRLPVHAQTDSPSVYETPLRDPLTWISLVSVEVVPDNVCILISVA